jgi:hypothetical protein
VETYISYQNIFYSDIGLYKFIHNLHGTKMYPGHENMTENEFYRRLLRFGSSCTLPKGQSTWRKKFKT